MRTNLSSESLPDIMPALPGAWREHSSHRPLPALPSPHTAQPDRLDRAYGKSQLSRVGIGVSSPMTSRALCRAVVKEETVLEQAMSTPPSPSLSRLLSLSGRYVVEGLGLRDGAAIRRSKLEDILRQMTADYAEWSEGKKGDSSAQTFLIRCVNYVKKLDRLKHEETFINTSLTGTQTEVAHPFLASGRNLQSDIERAKQKVNDWVTQAVLQTDLSLRADFDEQIVLLQAQAGTSQQRAAYNHVEVLAETIGNLKYLSPHSKTELHASLGQLREVLRDQ